MISWEALSKLQVRQRYPDKFYNHAVHYGLDQNQYPPTSTLDKTVYKAVVFVIDPDSKKKIVIDSINTSEPLDGLRFFNTYNNHIITLL